MSASIALATVVFPAPGSPQRIVRRGGPGTTSACPTAAGAGTLRPVPTYEYRCAGCGHELEIFQNISEAPKKKCPACKKQKLKRKIGGGAGFLFKGSGFYLTDYRSDSYKKAADADKKPADSGSKESGSKESSSKDGADGKKAAPAAEKKPREGKKKAQ